MPEGCRACVGEGNVVFLDLYLGGVCCGVGVEEIWGRMDVCVCLVRNKGGWGSLWWREKRGRGGI